MQSKSEIDKLITDNLGLAYYWAHKYFNVGEFDDVVGTAQLGLVKAAKAFDPSKGNKFPTFATIYIKKELLMQNRKNKRQIKALSLEAEVMLGNDYKTILLEETIPSDECFEDDIIDKLDLHNSFERVFKCLTENEKQCIILYYINGINQCKISEMLGLSQSYSSRLIKSGIRKIRQGGFYNEICS